MAAWNVGCRTGMFLINLLIARNLNAREGIQKMVYPRAAVERGGISVCMEVWCDIEEGRRKCRGRFNCNPTLWHTDITLFLLCMQAL
jgi:hypothetical protein